MEVSKTVESKYNQKLGGFGGQRIGEREERVLPFKMRKIRMDTNIDIEGAIPEDKVNYCH